MRILLVSAASSIHTARWANGLAGRGHEVHLASVQEQGLQSYSPEVQVHIAPHLGMKGYLASGLWLHRLERSIGPDVVNVHYATGYGTLARLARLSAPVLLSVWGSDVYDFPRRNKLCARLLRGNLASAARLASTSKAMAVVTRQYAAGRPISITPFGVDTDVFTPSPQSPHCDGSGVMRIGTVKAMYAKYGIDDLIRAFGLIRPGYPQVELHLYGDGPDVPLLKELAGSLGVEDAVIFHGAVAHDLVPEALNRLDIFAALSTLDSESFGVAIIEAGACGLPVVVTDVDGPAEVVEDGVTGFIVARSTPEIAAQAFEKLLDEEDLRRTMGRAGREHVEAEYSWLRSLELMEEAYVDTIKDARGITGRRLRRPRSRASAGDWDRHVSRESSTRGPDTT